MSIIKLLPTVIIFLIFVSCDAMLNNKNTIDGNGNIIELEFDHTDFTRIETGWACHSTITQADTFSVFIRIDENLEEYLNVYKSLNTLKIGLENDNSYRRFTFQVVITVPDLAKLDLSGASFSDLTGFDINHDAELECSGASRIFGILNSEDLEVGLSGASRLNLDGSGENLVISASGASTVDLESFTAQDADIELSGASVATVNISGILNAELSGASTLFYTGSPTLDNINTSGGSVVQEINP